MRILLSLFLLIVFFGFGVQIYRLNATRVKAMQQLETSRQAIEKMKDENRSFRSDLEYYADERNVAKEARSLLNYGAPGENVVIIVPKKSH